MMTLHFAEPGFVPLAAGPSQLIRAANGLFQAKENAAFRAVTRCAAAGSKAERIRIGDATRLWNVRLADPPASLAPLEEHLELKVKIREADFRRALDFFRRVLIEHGTEAFLFLAVNPSTGMTKLVCPNQLNRRAGVEVEVDTVLPDGYLKFGSFHSHPCSAFHSDVDRADENESDGLHMVCGDLTLAQPSFVAALVVWGRRRELTVDDVVERDEEFNDWMTRLRCGRTIAWKERS